MNGRKLLKNFVTVSGRNREFLIKKPECQEEIKTGYFPVSISGHISAMFYIKHGIFN
jgi:hypothetical protein